MVHIHTGRQTYILKNLKKSKKYFEWPGMVLQACNDRTWEAEAGASPASGKQQFTSARPDEIPISKQLWGRGKHGLPSQHSERGVSLLLAQVT